MLVFTTYGYFNHNLAVSVIRLLAICCQLLMDLLIETITLTADNHAQCRVHKDLARSDRRLIK